MNSSWTVQAVLVAILGLAGTAYRPEDLSAMSDQDKLNVISTLAGANGNILKNLILKAEVSGLNDEEIQTIQTIQQQSAQLLVAYHDPIA